MTKEVPLPHWFRNDVGRKYPWHKCEIGDSFIAAEPVKRVAAAMRKFCQRNKEFKFYSTETEAGEVRVWRIKWL